MARNAVLIGDKALFKKLSKLERELAPKALALALNRTATKVRQVTVKEIAAATGRKAKDVRGDVKTRARAKAPNQLRTDVTVTDRESNHRPAVPVSRPFSAPLKGGTFRAVRALRQPASYSGRGRSKGRPQSSPPNLPIYVVNASGTLRRKTSHALLRRELMHAAREKTATFFRPEFKRQLARQVEKFKLTRARANRR